MLSRVRKLLFTRRKSNQNGVLSVLNKSEAGFARAWQSGVVLVLCARKGSVATLNSIYYFAVVASLGI